MTVRVLLSSVALCHCTASDEPTDVPDEATEPGQADSGGGAPTASDGGDNGNGDDDAGDDDGDAEDDDDGDAGGDDDDDDGDGVVKSVAELREALLTAEPGDRIVVAPGEYVAPDAYQVDFAMMPRRVYYYSQSAGSPSQPITIESQDSDDKAVLEGMTTGDSAYILWINGAHWRVRNLVLRVGGKGLMLDEASESEVTGVEVYNVGDEGIHLRSGTSDSLVDGCIVDGTGLVQPGFGEGIYIGSDNSQWDLYERACNNNVVRDCEIRNSRAEGIDVKEGTTGNVVEGSSIYGAEIAGENFADSFIDLKGDGAQIRNNVFYRESNGTVTRGVAIVHRDVELTATNNWIFDNTFSLDDAEGVMVHAYDGLDNYAWDNVREPVGDEYAGNEPELYTHEP